MIIGRYKESCLEDSKILPSEWTEEFIKVLNNAYMQQSQRDQRFFDVHGRLFEKEFVVIISYIHNKDLSISPISIFIAHDIIENSKNMTKALDYIVDLSGLILDDIFAQSDWSDFVPNWTKNDFKDFQYYYKITRENFSLTLQAEEILKDNPLLK